MVGEGLNSNYTVDKMSTLYDYCIGCPKILLTLASLCYIVPLIVLSARYCDVTAAVIKFITYVTCVFCSGTICRDVCSVWISYAWR